MAVATVAPRISPVQPSVITSETISRYAEITAHLSQLEAQQKALRNHLREMPETGPPHPTGPPSRLDLRRDV